ncbi:class I SAM-dependent methyltransferase [Salipiger sp.]|uniref:class I SAM-dependent methyltransferase n=1 Tax=Salipiger sp. TaxID=2078585 RepID=UPI003A96CDD2
MNISPNHNRDLRDDIREYWSDRAATFDQDPGHRIAEGAELSAWEDLFRRHLGPAEGRRLLDLASGTGEIARLTRGLGFHVTGLDWSERMLDRARSKLPDVTFLQADAERTMLPDACMDVIVTRHLVWTLVDPQAAFAEWHRVLVPGGRILVVDGDFVNGSWLTRLLAGLRAPAPAPSRQRHQEILRRVHFSGGARAELVTDLLAGAGFAGLRIDRRLGRIHRAQAAQLGWRRSLMRNIEHRYAISATKPAEG